VWLFGSAIRDADPRDIDLLVVYDRELVAPQDAYILGDTLAVALGDCKPRVSIILLTRNEHMFSEFARRESATCVWP
jgi:hypothetical protein